jgi:hypothetical protein
MFQRIDNELNVRMGVTDNSLEHMPVTVAEAVKRIWELRQTKALHNVSRPSWQ